MKEYVKHHCIFLIFILILSNFVSFSRQIRDDKVIITLNYITVQELYKRKITLRNFKIYRKIRIGSKTKN